MVVTLFWRVGPGHYGADGEVAEPASAEGDPLGALPRDGNDLVAEARFALHVGGLGGRTRLLDGLCC